MHTNDDETRGLGSRRSMGLLQAIVGLLSAFLLHGLVNRAVGPLGALAGAAALDLTTTMPGAPEAATRGGPEHEVFGLTRIHTVHLQVAASEWRAIEPRTREGSRAASDVDVAGPPAGSRNDEAREFHTSVFGLEFPWVRGDVTFDGATYASVGLRYKGNGSYLPSRNGLKRNFKIKLDKYKKGLHICGLRTLNLNAAVMDPSKAREAIAYAAFSDAGVPSPRTAFAHVTLTVPGVHDREYLGVYTLVEQVNKGFLERWFGDGKHLLLKPESPGGLEWLGEDWKAYESRYRPEDKAPEQETARVIAFARLLNQAGDERFRAEIGTYLDIEKFLRFLAINALLVNLDSLFAMPHNFYLYLDPHTEKLVFIPWDLDLSLGAWPNGGPPERQADLSIMHPHLGANPLIDRVLGIPEMRARYRELLAEFAATTCSKDRLCAAAEAIEKAIAGLRAREEAAAAARNEPANPFLARAGKGRGPPDLREFIARRADSVARQLAGLSTGQILRGRPSAGMFGAVFAAAIKARADADKDGRIALDELIALASALFEECARDGFLDADGIAAGMDLLAPPPDAPPPERGDPRDPGRKRRDSSGPGRGNPVAKPLLRAVDADQDGRVSKGELTAGVRKFFNAAGKDGANALTEARIAEELNRLFPQNGGPPGFRQP